MKRGRGLRRHQRRLCRAGGIAALAGAALPLSGCLATAAVITTAYTVEMLSEMGYTMTVKAEAPPRELYNKLVSTIKARNPGLEVQEENAKERRFRAKGLDAEGVRVWVSFVVGPLPDETSQLLVAAGRDGKEGSAVRHWMIQQIGSVFEEMGIEWKVAAAATPETDARHAFKAGSPRTPASRGDS